MRKRIVTLIFASFILTSLTACGSSSDAQPETASTIEVKEDTSSQEDMPEEEMDEAEALWQEEEEDSIKFAASGLEDAYDLQSFVQLTMTTTSKEIEMDTESYAEGLLIKGDSQKFKDAVFTLEKSFDFGDKSVDRLEIDGLSDTETVLQVFLDEESEPIASFTLNLSGQEGESEDAWSEEKPLVADLSDLGIHGSHTIKLRFRMEENDAAQTQIMLRSMQFIEASVPVLYFNIDESKGTIEAMNNDEAHETKCYGDVTITVPNGYENSYDEESSFTGGTYKLSYIRGRGNSSWSTFVKKPYKIKLDDASDLFGMGENKHWVLLSGACDRSMLDNRFTYQLADAIGLQYSIQCLNVDVYMNGKYMGDYLLSEQVRIDENRVELDDLTADYDENTMSDQELSGGYLLGKINNSSSVGEYGFQTKHGSEFTVVEPESDTDFTYEKANEYIEGFIQRIECAIFHEKNADGIVENVWDLMDLESTVKYFLIQYVSNNSDAYHNTSTYMYKARDMVGEDGSLIESKLFWGPIWDFDMGWCASVEDTVPEEVIIDDIWMSYLLKYDDTFQQALVEYWPEVREALVHIASDDGILDGYVDEMLPSAIHNYQVNHWIKWTDTYQESENVEEDGKYIIKDYYLDLIAAQKNWIMTRVKWMDQHIDSLKPARITVTYMSEDEVFYQTEEPYGKMYDFPEEIPVSRDPNRVFTGWFALMDDGEGGSTETRLKASDILSVYKIESTEDGYALTVTAHFGDADQTVIPDEITFDQDVYEVDCREGNKKLGYSVEIHYSYSPENATETSFDWTVSNNSGVLFFDDEDAHCLTVLFSKPRDYLVTGRTCDGKTYTCQIHGEK